MQCSAAGRFPPSSVFRCVERLGGRTARGETAALFFFVSFRVFRGQLLAPAEFCMTPDTAPSSRPARTIPVCIAQALLAALASLLLVVIAATAFDTLANPSSRAASLPLRVLLVASVLAGPIWWLWPRFGGARRPVGASLALLASLVLFGAWLARDESRVVHEGVQPLLRSDFADAAETHALVLRYTAGTAEAARWADVASATVAREFAALQSHEARAAFVVEHRAAIEELWAQVEPLRAWFDELAAAPALADLTESITDPAPAFAPIRAFARAAAVRSALLAVDGRGDQAVSVLLPVLFAGQKLEPHSRTLVRRMVATVVQRSALQSLDFVLEQGGLGAEARMRLSEALSDAPDPAQQCRLLVLCEYPLSARMMMESPAQAAGPSALPVAGVIGGLFYNPVATANALGDFLEESAAAAERRDLDAVRLAAERRVGARLSAKNFSGRLLIAMTAPAYSKVVETRWQAHDERAALLSRL
jgi:hypothetical protein